MNFFDRDMRRSRLQPSSRLTRSSRLLSWSPRKQGRSKVAKRWLAKELAVLEERKASVTDKARSTTPAASKLHVGHLKKTAHDVAKLLGADGSLARNRCDPGTFRDLSLRLWGLGSAFQTLGWGPRGAWSGPESPIPIKEYSLNHNMKPYII